MAGIFTLRTCSGLYELERHPRRRPRVHSPGHQSKPATSASDTCLSLTAPDTIIWRKGVPSTARFRSRPGSPA